MKIGLALGSGAARGWAHIGIIEALEELGVKVSAVSGCSIGSYVGAAYCAGNLSELKSWVSDLTEWQVAKLMGVSMQKGGLVSGEKVFAKLTDDFATENIQDLTIPFSAVATDMRRGQEIIFSEGSTLDAVRASCSIPGIFPPHRFQNRWLLDGAVVNPVPVTLCRQLGVDIVIAVNLGSDFNPAETELHNQQQKKNEDKFNQFMNKSMESFSQWWESAFSSEEKEPKQAKPDKPTPPSLINCMSNALDIMQDRVTRSRLAGDPPDILLSPKLGHIGIMEFHRAQEAIEIGRASVMRVAEQIKYQLNLE
ncbi:patatin-like phospholipase RssA [Thalassotalea sp. M1531]|uniref:Patatin-like phospholipase RssA n=1 Tax=Thalassotalea algicola TaxID=2716224 RepID=A0A7Y0LBA0_9GAMM|nr:patatin-like phospholipase RssA [Thalassotalea algicola]NMP31162.1 patatin-like phospholipase RssA [Thalassotalea algicola]